MKSILSGLSFLFVASLVGADAPAAAPATNVMIITADGSFEYEGNTAVYRRNVRAVDAQMNLACELLTIYFSASRPGASTAAQGIPTNSQRIEMIVAETNVVIAQQDTVATGQRAVYTATNELMVLTGQPLLETPQGYLSCSNLFYDRIRNKLWGVGGIVMSNKPGVNLFGTNSLGLSLPGAPRPSRPAARPR